ncbi:ATP-dependent helicase/nuclease subunit A, partial [human gut metagenome]
QDSNNVQETIIELVSRRKDEFPNVFMVGDVKQSIYRFRQAKPELFMEKYINYTLEESNNRKIQLYKNFRSRKEVIDGVNYIFKEIMSETVGELEHYLNP